MAKLCPQCEKENPTVANVCMFCGASFAENAETNPTDQLNKELNEAKKDLQFYRKSLEEANSKIEELKSSMVSAANNAAKELEKQLAIKEKQNSILTQQINAEKKRKAGWAWFFFSLCVILAIVFIAVIGNVSTNTANNADRISELENQIGQLKNENKVLSDLKKGIEQENKKLRAENDRLLKQNSQLKDNQTKDNQPVKIDNNKNANNKNISINSNSSTNSYRVIVKTYFYDYVNNGQFKLQNHYLVTNDVVKITMQMSGYGYTEFTNSEGKITKGWLKMSDLSKN